MPNQMQCSFTCSITLLQLARWLVSTGQERDSSEREQVYVRNRLKKVKSEAIVPAGIRLYLRTSQRTSLLGSRENGSLNMRTGLRYMSLLEPSDWYVLEPSKFHSGISAQTNEMKNTRISCEAPFQKQFIKNSEEAGSWRCTRRRKPAKLPDQLHRTLEHFRLSKEQRLDI